MHTPLVFFVKLYLFQTINKLSQFRFVVSGFIFVNNAFFGQTVEHRNYLRKQFQSCFFIFSSTQSFDKSTCCFSLISVA